MNGNSNSSTRRRAATVPATPSVATPADGLVTLFREQPTRPGGPVRAEVAVTELEHWLARGWQQAPAPGEVDGA